MQTELANIISDCVSEFLSVQTGDENTAFFCQQECRDRLHAYSIQCSPPEDDTNLEEYCNNAGSSAEAPTFVKALFVITFIVIAMLLL